MRFFTVPLILFHSLMVSVAIADETIPPVKVADPFLEIHTGPSAGYPTETRPVLTPSSDAGLDPIILEKYQNNLKI